MNNRVVKCKNGKCGLYFMYTEKNTKCPFCYIEYGEVIEKETKDPSTSFDKTPDSAKATSDKQDKPLGAGKKRDYKNSKKNLSKWSGS